ncbi:uncharacterized protein LOC132034777 [Lycium ferocissimum]|uniref:uncharacterized protein LOC132034777 n=1 Tax=Lycium ferocissimum TaxID=112874 RepID=UPI0028157D1B|nr:uncharacterized protein LOC132034777 [Lycium ferocissimum]
MERRSTFRFRLPWSQPASEPEPASKPSTQPNTKTGPKRTTTRQVTRTRTASQPSSSTTPKSSPSSSPATENSTGKQPPSTTASTKSRKPSSPPQPSAESKAPIQSITNTSPLPESTSVPPQPSAESKTPIQSTATNTSPSLETKQVPPQSSSATKAPVQSFTTDSKPTNAPASPNSETQTPTTPTSTIAQSPQSNNPSEIAPTKTESQPLIPSQEQQGITSQPASPSDVATKSNASQSPSRSPPHPASQSQETSPKSSPSRKGPQVLPTDQLTPKAARPASQTSSNLPLGITSQGQPKDQTIAQPISRPKQSQESSETSSKSTEKEPMPATAGPQSEQMELPKKEAISNTFPEAKDKSPEKVIQPSELSEVRSTRGITEGPSKTSDTSRIIGEPKMDRLLEIDTSETKEVKKVVQETRDKIYGVGEKVGGSLTSKEQPNSVFQSKQAYTEKQANYDDDQFWVNRVSNGKQTSKISSQLKNKIAASGSKETAVSAEQEITLNKEVKDNISKFIHRMAVGDGKQNLGETPVSVITLAGDNRGASMQLGSYSSRKGRVIRINRGYKLNADESADATTDAEGNSEGRQPNDARTIKDQEIEAYLNCNVQGLNNSITFDSSVEGKNPGIHMLFPRMPSEPIKSSEGTGVFEAHKAEFNVTPAQKQTYEPTIRRRCLEGLFFEPNDSDSDNPEEPWQHGHHVGGMEKRENEIDIL